MQRGMQALDHFGDALDQQQRQVSGTIDLERPEQRPPRRLLGGLADAEGVPGFVGADEEEQDQRRKEQSEIGDRMIMPLVRVDQLSKKKSVRMCAPLCSA